MKKAFNTYAVIWVIALVVFNAISFVTASQTVGISNVGANFWLGYAFITITLLVNLAVSFVLLKTERASKSFLNLSVLYIAYIALICSAIVGAVVMAILSIPWWVGFIINLLLLALYAVAIISSNAAAQIVDSVDNKVKEQMIFVKLLTADAQTLLAKASPETKASVNKVCEAIRYSDPMSEQALAGVESQITIKFNEYSNAVVDNDYEFVSALEKELLILIQDRNNKCKVLK